MRQQWDGQRTTPHRERPGSGAFYGILWRCGSAGPKSEATGVSGSWPGVGPRGSEFGACWHVRIGRLMCGWAATQDGAGPISSTGTHDDLVSVA